MSKHDYNHWGRFYPSVNSLSEAKDLYDKTVPIRGARKKYDLRPIGNMRTGHDASYRVVKLDDGKYTLTYAHRYDGSPELKLDLDKEQGVTWLSDTQFELHCSRLSWHGVLNFISQVLPGGMRLNRYDTKIYVAISRGDTTDYYYTGTDKDRVVLKFELDSNGQWQVLNPIQEYRSRVTPEAKQLVHDELSEFEQYAETIWDMVTPDVAAANDASGSAYWIKHSGYSEGVKTRVRDKSTWLRSVAELKQVRWANTAWGKREVKEKFNPGPLRERAYRAFKEKFKTDIVVPIGTRCYRHHILK